MYIYCPLKLVMTLVQENSKIFWTKEFEAEKICSNQGNNKIIENFHKLYQGFPPNKSPGVLKGTLDIMLILSAAPINKSIEFGSLRVLATTF